MKLSNAIFLPTLVFSWGIGAASAQDADADGIPNSWETTWHLNPSNPDDALLDFDRDGLTSLQEYTLSLQGLGEGPLGKWTAEFVTLAGVASPQSTIHRKKVVGLNDNGDVLIAVDSNSYPPTVGSERYSAWVRRASDGSWRSLSTVNGTVASYLQAYGINDAGEIVGVAKAAGVNGGNEFAFKKNIFEGTPSTDVAPWYLPGQSSAPAKAITAINNHGDLIGKDTTGASFFYKQALGSTVALPGGWSEVDYVGLNNMGQVSGIEYSDPWGGEAYSHFLRSSGWNWHAQYPAYTTGAIDTNGIEPPYYTPLGTFSPTVFNDWGEFAGAYSWRISIFEGPNEEDAVFNTGSWFFDGSGYRELLPTDTYAGQVIYDTNNWPQTLVSGYTDEWGEDIVTYIHMDGVNVPLSAISPVPAIGNNTYGSGIPRQINNRSTIVGIIENQQNLYFLRLSQDSDGDMMSNDWETYHGLDPDDPSDARADADNDGYPNLAEYRLGGDPTDPGNHSSAGRKLEAGPVDSDDDGLPDSWEMAYFPSASSPWCAPGTDDDGDTLSNMMEWVLGTDPADNDTDGDGLPDNWEMAHGLDPRDDGTVNPANGASGVFQDSGLPNLQAFLAGVQAHANATLADFDGDGEDNATDADPADGSVSWPATTEARYALVEVEVPTDAGTVKDFNDAGDVLFDAGVWSGGDFAAKTADDLAGSYPVEGEDDQLYVTHFTGWHSLNNAGSLMGWAHIEFTSGQAAGGDGLASVGSWIANQSPRNLPDSIPFQDYIGPGFSPMGLDQTGRSYARMGYYTNPSPGTYVAETRLVVFGSSGNVISSLQGPGGYHPTGGGGHFDVSGSGWVATNTADAPSGSSSYRLGLWNEQLAPVALSGNRIALAAGLDSGQNSKIYLEDPGTGAMQFSPSLSQKKIRLFAGDGTAMTSDDKIYRNGSLIPLAELCEDYADLKSQGWSFWPFRSNAGGAYLVQAIGPAGEEKTFVMPKVEIILAGTADEKDDLVAVSGGTDEDLATDISLRVGGMANLTAKLGVKGADGQVKYKDTEIPAPANTWAATKVWGLGPSSAKDMTKLSVTLKKGTKDLGVAEKKATVFKGVKFEFDGVFGSPIDSIKEGWRPFSLYQDPADAISADVGNYSSALSFHDGDQGGLALRAHSPARNVSVKSVTTVTPAVVLYGPGSTPIDAEIAAAQVWFLTGRFEPTLPPPNDPSGHERILNAELEFKKAAQGGGQGLFGIKSTSNDPRITTNMTKNPPLPIIAEVAAAKATNKLAEWIHEYAADTSVVPRPKTAVPGDADSIAYFLENMLSRASADYTSDFFQGVKKAGTATSIAAKGVLGAEQAGQKIEFKVTLEKWNGWKLTGEANDGSVTNK